MKNYVNLSLFFSVILLLFTFGCQESVQLDPLNPTAAAPGGNGPNISNTLMPATCTIDPTDHHCFTRPLIAGQNYQVGRVRVWCIDGTDDYKIQYEITGHGSGCTIKEVHLAVGTEADIPKNGGGCPKIGHFPYKLENLDTNSVCFSIGTFTGPFTVAAHAVVECTDSDSPFIGEETAWGRGKNFPGCNNWSMCFDADCVDMKTH